MEELLLKQWGKRIAQNRRLRNAEGEIRRKFETPMSQEDLAELIGVRQPTVSRWEMGRNEPSVKHKRLIAEALGVSMDALFSYPVVAA